MRFQKSALFTHRKTNERTGMTSLYESRRSSNAQVGHPSSPSAIPLSLSDLEASFQVRWVQSQVFHIILNCDAHPLFSSSSLPSLLTLFTRTSIFSSKCLLPLLPPPPMSRPTSPSRAGNIKGAMAHASVGVSAVAGSVRRVTRPLSCESRPTSLLLYMTKVETAWASSLALPLALSSSSPS